MSRLGAVCLAAGLLLAGAAQAAEIRVVSSGGFAAAWRTLAPVFERQTGDHVVMAWGPSMGTTHNAIPVRLARGERFDVLIMVGPALGKLVAQGKVTADSRADLADSLIGAAVRAGAPHPDIASVAALRRTLLVAASIAYSDSASGVYIQNELFARLGIADQVAGKAHMIPAEPVGAVVARGAAQIGFQQLSELRPVAGIDVLGPLPDAVQKHTIFAAGMPVDAAAPDAARALIRFLASPAARPAITASGLVPLGAGHAPSSQP